MACVKSETVGCEAREARTTMLLEVESGVASAGVTAGW
jgi:hypothetical protein